MLWNESCHLINGGKRSMYCSTCGHLNNKHDLYCSNDGTRLKKTDIKVNFRENGAFCASCGTKTSKSDSYCSSCGHVLVSGQVAARNGTNEVVWTKSADLTNIPAQKWFKFNFDIKQSLLSAVAAFVVVIVFALILMTGSKSILNSLITESMDGTNFTDMLSEIETETDTNMPKLDSIVGFTDYVMAEHLQIPKIAASVKGSAFGDEGYFNGSVTVGIGMLIYLIGPFIGLFLAGIYAGRKIQNTSLMKRFNQSIGIGICYAIILSIFSLFSGFSKKINIHDHGFNISFHMGVNYSIFGVFVSTLFFGILFSFLGILFAMNFRKTTGNLKEIPQFGQAIHQGFSVFYRGFGLFAIVSIIVFWVIGSKYNFFEYLEQNIDFFTVSKMKVFYYLTFGLQFGFYIWSSLHFAPFGFNYNVGNEKGNLAYHIFSGFKGEGSVSEGMWVLENSFTSHHIDLYLKLAIIIPIALFLYAGYKMGKSKTFSWKSVILFSLIYSLFMSITAGFTNLEMVLKYNGTDVINKPTSLFFGFHPFGMFIRSFIFSFIVSYAGSFINKIVKKA
ncbi:hypothetical protein B5V88_15435 [Heyndrickxia sporothermodurans]|nr:hypothetical protein B5V88_15435 [Heyndrickxia sporothermodurans]PTY79409.1 hypothetical protein B5V89_05425 [Heyndrickxia sporothermodurans]